MRKFKTIFDLSARSAKKFLLRSTNYFSGDLPPYIKFTDMLHKVDKIIATSNGLPFNAAKNYPNTNYSFYVNKDGKYAWRNFQLINPILYVELLNILTNSSNWQNLKRRFSDLKSPNIYCASIPVLKPQKRTQKSQQILAWWEQVEQQSIALSLDFQCIHITDISDFYPSIYTHSIPWALHGKEIAKTNRDKNLLGNQIDAAIQQMQYGQTNGIPQGSTVMDLISELILAYADHLLAEKLDDIKIKYKIIRYRDDYRIFTKNQHDGEKIIKELSQVLLSLNLKLNTAKTFASNEIILNSIKKDKLAMLLTDFRQENIQKRLVQIYNFACAYPNSNQVKKHLIELNKLLHDAFQTKYPPDKKTILAISVQLAYNNPTLYAHITQILSTIFSHCNQSEIQKFINKIFDKFQEVPNHAFLEIWLQRLALPYGITISYKEKLCCIIESHANAKPVKKLWNTSWVSNNKLKKALHAKNYISLDIISKLNTALDDSEIDLFHPY